MLSDTCNGTLIAAMIHCNNAILLSSELQCIGTGIWWYCICILETGVNLDTATIEVATRAGKFTFAAYSMYLTSISKLSAL